MTLPPVQMGDYRATKAGIFRRLVMAWSNGWYFGKSENEELHGFLEAQGLDQKQITSITAYHRSRVTGQLNLWVGSISLLAFFLGLFFANFFGLSNCFLF